MELRFGVNRLLIKEGGVSITKETFIGLTLNVMVANRQYGFPNRLREKGPRYNIFELIDHFMSCKWCVRIDRKTEIYDWIYMRK